MIKKTILTALFMMFTTLTTTMADNDKDGRNNGNFDEIDNYDFLYENEEYDSDFQFSTVDDMLDEAFSHLGARYRSGMAGPYAFDCSGFTSYVFKNIGINLNRSSRAQYTQGEAVSKSDLRSGDLVFFTSPRSGRNVGHVGIVVDVNQMNGSFNFIHASSSGVKVSSSSEGAYSRRYVGARRVK